MKHKGKNLSTRQPNHVDAAVAFTYTTVSITKNDPEKENLVIASTTNAQALLLSTTQNILNQLTDLLPL